MSKYNFGEYNSVEKLKNLVKNFENFKNDNSDVSSALELCSNAWHLTDFVFEEYKSNLALTDLGTFRNSLFTSCDKLRIIHDLANASKHGGELSRPKASIKKTEKHHGAFSSGFSSDFDISYLSIILEDNTELDFFDVISDVVEFWELYFKNKLGVGV